MVWVLSVASLSAAAPPVAAQAPDKDPRNWPTVTRLIADRYEHAGEVITLRVHAKSSGYFACDYRHTHGRLMAFTLLGGPLETLTGYIAKDLGRVLERELQDDPWLPITVQVRFDPERLSDICPDQVEILKWSRSWQYPTGSLSPGKADPTMHPTERELRAVADSDTWVALTGRKKRRRRTAAKPPPSEASLLGKKVTVTAGARLSVAYHCMFRGATRTHYALRLHDGRGNFLHAYLPRSAEARLLLDQIALHRDLLVSVRGTVVKQVPSNYCRSQIEVEGWTLPRATGRAKP